MRLTKARRRVLEMLAGEQGEAYRRLRDFHGWRVRCVEGGVFVERFVLHRVIHPLFDGGLIIETEEDEAAITPAGRRALTTPRRKR